MNTAILLDLGITIAVRQTLGLDNQRVFKIDARPNKIGERVVSGNFNIVNGSAVIVLHLAKGEEENA